MLASVDPNNDTGLEIAPYQKDLRKWCIWLRSDISHSKCRFCFLRSVETMEQVIALMQAITDTPVVRRPRDESEFAIALGLEAQDCERRRREYIMDDRWGRIPGYL